MNLRFLMLFLLGLSLAGTGFSTAYSSCASPPSGSHELSGNVAATGHCFWLSSNTVFDCKGFEIVGNNGGIFGFLLNINKNNVTIKNCVVRNFQLGTYIDASSNVLFDNFTSYSNQYGIWGKNANFNFVINNSKTYSNSAGVFFGPTASNISVYNHISYGNSDSGLTLMSDGGVVKNLTSYSNKFGAYFDTIVGTVGEDFNLTSNVIGMIVSKSEFITLNNINLSNSVLSSGLVLQMGTNNSVVSNINSNNNQFGVAVSDGLNNTFNNLNISNSLNIGLYTAGATNELYVYNSSIFNSVNYDIAMDSLAIVNQCNNIFSNITGTNNLPIKYFNSTVSLSNEQLAELLLCDADGSTIDNVTINSGTNFQNNAMMSFFVDDSNFTDVKISNTRWGLYFRNSSNNLIDNYDSVNNYVGSLIIASNYMNLTNSDVYNSSTNGILLNMGGNNSVINFSSNLAVAGTSFEVRDSDNNYFENIIINDTKVYSGFYLMRSSNNIVKNLNSSFNFLNGVVVFNNSDYNSFFGNINLFNNTIGGISFGSSVGGNYSEMKIYSNDGSGIVMDDTTLVNIFNSSLYSNFGEGLALKHSNNNIFSNLVLSESKNYSGLYLFNSSSNQILNVTSNNNFLNGVTVTNGSNDNYFIDSSFNFNNKNGFTSSIGSKSTDLVNSNFKNNLGVGIAVGIDSNVSIFNSESYSNLLGIIMENSSNNSINNSRVLGNVGGVYFLGDSDNSEIFNSSVYSNFLGDVYFDAKNLSFPDNNVLFGNTFDDVSKIFTDVNFTINPNFFNSSRLGFGNVGNYWTEFSCDTTDVRGDYLVCLSPINLLIDLTFNIFDYAPLSNHPGLIENVTTRELDYVFPTLPDGTKFSKSNFTIKFGDGVTDISPCLAKVNNVVGGVTFSDGYCTLKISNISGGKQDITFQAHSSQFVFPERTVHYYPNPDSMFELSGFNVLSILTFISVVGLFLW